jgi:hypothetical protein
MTTVADFGEYTGVHGLVQVDNVTFADIEYDVKWSRTTVTHSRASKFSDIQIPGKLTVKTTIKKALVHSEAAMVMGYSLNDTPITGAAETQKTGLTVTADGYQEMTTPVISAASRIRCTVVDNSMTTAGTLTLVGEDVNGTAISEILSVGLLAAGEYVTSTKVFKELAGITVNSIRSTGSGTFTVTSLSGSSSYTVGEPKIFDIVGSVSKAGKSITITQPNCWFVEGGLSFADAGKILEISTAVEMHDPDLLEVDVVG